MGEVREQICGAIGGGGGRCSHVFRGHLIDDAKRAREFVVARQVVGEQLNDDLPVGLSDARGETVGEKPSFRDAFRRHRVVVPMDGFYEWAPAPPDGPRTRSGRPAKRPHLFSSVDGEVLNVAGIASIWRRGGGELRTFAVVTTEANSTMAPIHDRMPVLLGRDARERAAIADWNPGVAAARLESGSATGVGAVRHLDIVDGSVFRETLLAHSDLEHSYSYDNKYHWNKFCFNTKS